MSVLINTSYGDLVVDLFCDDTPKAARNFLKLCKYKYYNNNVFYKIEKDFILETGKIVIHLTSLSLITCCTKAVSEFIVMVQCQICLPLFF